MVQQVVEFGVEGRVGVGKFVGGFKLFERGHQGLGHVAAAIGAEAPLHGLGHLNRVHHRCHGHSPLTANKNAADPVG